MKKMIVALIIVCVFFVQSVSAAEKEPINDIYTIIFIMDGLNYDTFIRAVNNGSAPNIKRYFIDDGAYFTDALSLFPSASPAVYQSFVSGLFPGHSGITYLGWFDRTTLKPVNYLGPSGYKHLDVDFLNLKTLLDPDEPEHYPPSIIFDRLKGYETAAIYSFYSAGATSIRPGIPFAAGWSTLASGREEMFDVYALRDADKLFAQPLEKLPRFTLVGLYGFDALAHHFGAGSAILDHNLQMFDDFLGRFISTLKERGIFGKTYIVLSADHGMHNTPGSEFDLKKFIRTAGLTLYPGRPGAVSYDAYVADRGIASAHIYIKGEDGWLTRPDLERMLNYPLHDGGRLNIVDSLVNTKELKFAVVRTGFHNVAVFSKNGFGLITTFTKDNKDLYSYKVEKGNIDPLEMNASRAAHLVGGGFYSADVWGELTADHKYPDAVVQLAQVFADGRSGDIFVIAEDNWVFYRGKSATHGSIIRADMHVPLLMRGPTVPKGEYGFARLVDIYPTMLKWYGIKGNEKHYDGRGLFEKAGRGGVPAAISPHRALHRTVQGRGGSYQKLQKIYDDLKKQKENPKKYHFTPDIVLDSNMWLIDQQMKR